jgi:hypothetical protein
VICRPEPGATPADFAPHAAAEMTAVRQLRAQHGLSEAYLLGGPGAVLVFDADRSEVEPALATLPLVQAGLISTEVIELHPFPH